MTEQKSYKDFPPLGLSEGRWDLADELVDHTKTSSRRPHLQAYVKYMSPAVESVIPKLWERATKAVCLMFDKKGFKQVPEATFDFRVDEKAFDTLFKHVREDKDLVAPSWPWQDDQFPEVDPNMKKSKAYATYLAKKDRDAKTAARKGSAAGPTPGHGPDAMTGVTGPAAEAQSAQSSLSPLAPDFKPEPKATGRQAPRKDKGLGDSMFATPKKHVNAETLTGPMTNSGSVKQQKKRLWDEVWGRDAFFGPVVGEFKMKLEGSVPTDYLLSAKSLAAANNQLMGCTITWNTSERILGVDFLPKWGPNHLGARSEFLRTWSHLRSWLLWVYNKAPFTLGEFIVECTTADAMNIGKEGDQLAQRHLIVHDDFMTMRSELRDACETRDRVRMEIISRITGSQEEIDVKLTLWVMSQMQDRRELCANIAMLEWLQKCKPSERSGVFAWGRAALNHCKQAKEHSSA